MAQGRMPLHQARNVAPIKTKTTEAADLNIDDTGQTRAIFWMQNAGFGYLTFFLMRPVHSLVGVFCSMFTFRRVILHTKDNDFEVISLLTQ
jgi:hypothetical protein